jgi:hypothetical protein
VVTLLLVLLTAAAQAGVPQPLHGSVRDQTGAVLQGADVELTDETDTTVASPRARAGVGPLLMDAKTARSRLKAEATEDEAKALAAGGRPVKG